MKTILTLICVLSLASAAPAEKVYEETPGNPPSRVECAFDYVAIEWDFSQSDHGFTTAMCDDAGLAVWEAIAPAKKLPVIKGWKLRGLTSFVIYFYLSSYLPMFTDGYLIQYQLFDLTGLGTVGGTIAGVIVFQLGTWLWHRSMHASDFLWHTFHQMHHSAERLDMYGANYFSITD